MRQVVAGTQVEVRADVVQPPERVPDAAATGMLRHLAWRAAPVVEIDLDLEDDVLLVTFYESLPTLEIDPSRELSIGFHQDADEYLLTSLCLAPASAWADRQAAAVRAAAELLGGAVVRMIDELREGGCRTVGLDQDEAAELVGRWRRFVLADAAHAVTEVDATEVDATEVDATDEADD